ncbi:hypothetical protein D3C87_1749570 [compost metagenome]
MVARNGFDADRKPVARRLPYPIRDLRTTPRQIRNTRKAGTKNEAVAATAQAIEPIGSLVGGKTVENSDRRCQIAFQRSEHDGLGRHVALGKKNAEGQAIRDRQSAKKDQEQSRAKGAWPPAEAGRAAHTHVLGTEISTGTENT